MAGIAGAHLQPGSHDVLQLLGLGWMSAALRIADGIIENVHAVFDCNNLFAVVLKEVGRQCSVTARTLDKSRRSWKIFYEKNIFTTCDTRLSLVAPGTEDFACLSPLRSYLDDHLDRMAELLQLMRT